MTALANPIAPVLPDASLELLRCDRCGAEGKVRVVLSSGMDLVFCGHHDREYATTLTVRDVSYLS